MKISAEIGEPLLVSGTPKKGTISIQVQALDGSRQAEFRLVFAYKNYREFDEKVLQISLSNAARMLVSICPVDHVKYGKISEDAFSAFSTIHNEYMYAYDHACGVEPSIGTCEREISKDKENSISGSGDSVYVFMSSGKDSNLSYKILKELEGKIAKQVVPVFCCPQSRYWFAAVERYRQMVAEGLDPILVWTNANRFASFLSKNFANPKIRDVTVRGTWIHGALPVLPHAKWIVFGNEYNCTEFSSVSTHPLGRVLPTNVEQTFPFQVLQTEILKASGFDCSYVSVIQGMHDFSVLKTLLNVCPEIADSVVSCNYGGFRNGKANMCGKCQKCQMTALYYKTLGKQSTRIKLSNFDKPLFKPEELAPQHIDLPFLEHISYLNNNYFPGVATERKWVEGIVFDPYRNNPLRLMSEADFVLLHEKLLEVTGCRLYWRELEGVVTELKTLKEGTEKLRLWRYDWANHVFMTLNPNGGECV